MAKVKKWGMWIIIVLAVIGSIVWYVKSHTPKMTYTTADVIRGDLAQTVSETGTIRTVNQTNLSFKVSGRVVSLLADVGDRIMEGQLLARLDLGTLNASLVQADQNVKMQKETLASMKHKKSQYNSDDRDAQEHRIGAAQADIAAVQSQIRDTYMYSPIDGVILKRNVESFETTVANSPTPVFTVGNPDDMVIETEVPESDITKMRIGQKATVTFDALPADQSFVAIVTKIDPASTVIQDVVDYRIELKLESGDDRIKPGMSVNIDIHTAEKAGVLMIPQRAVKTDNNNKETVDTLQADNTTKTISVETGLNGDDGMVEVTKGLKEGDKVVTFVATK
jgi:HlyD family secretion protein